eukprot:s44_g34.t1
MVKVGADQLSAGWLSTSLRGCTPLAVYQFQGMQGGDHGLIRGTISCFSEDVEAESPPKESLPGLSPEALAHLEGKAVGVIKSYLPLKRYGFITSSDCARDLYFKSEEPSFREKLGISDDQSASLGVFYAERLVAERPCDETTYLLGLAYFHNQEMARAQWHLQGNKLPDARYLLARCCLQMKRWDLAEDALLSGGTLNDVVNGAAGLFLLGQVQERQGRREQAVQCYAKCLQDCPFMWDAYERWSWLVLGSPSTAPASLAATTFSDEKFAQSFVTSKEAASSTTSRPAGFSSHASDRLSGPLIIRSRERSPAGDPGSEGVALPMPTRKDTKSSKLSPSLPAESLCILCDGQVTEGKSESLSWSADTAESCHILTSLAESVRHAQKSMDFHCNRIVSLAGRDGDLAGHVLCASKGAAEVVSELCNAIAETLLDVEVYKGQLESMFKNIALGREQLASESQNILEETGVTFGENHDSED